MAAHDGPLALGLTVRQLVPEPAQLRLAGASAKFDKAPRRPHEPLWAVFLLCVHAHCMRAARRRLAHHVLSNAMAQDSGELSGDALMHCESSFNDVALACPMQAKAGKPHLIRAKNQPVLNILFTALLSEV